jgi:hypothetical protein
LIPATGWQAPPQACEAQSRAELALGEQTAPLQDKGNHDFFDEIKLKSPYFINVISIQKSSYGSGEKAYNTQS